MFNANANYAIQTDRDRSTANGERESERGKEKERKKDGDFCVVFFFQSEMIVGHSLSLTHQHTHVPIAKYILNSGSFGAAMIRKRIRILMVGILDKHFFTFLIKILF